MKKPLLIIFTLFFGLFLLQACGPSEEEKRMAEQARLDSLEQVRADSIARVRADSIAKAEEEARLAEQREKERKDREMRDYRFSDTGKLTVQVDSWRTIEFAKAGLERWKDRGFDNAYLVEWGEEESGEVWYRLRIGRFASPQMAERLQYVLNEDYGQISWVDNYRDLPRVDPDRVREGN